MKPVVEATGGMVVQTDTFLNPVFKESFKRVFALEAEDGYLAVASNATFEVPPPLPPAARPPPPSRCAPAPRGGLGAGRRRARRTAGPIRVGACRPRAPERCVAVRLQAPCPATRSAPVAPAMPIRAAPTARRRWPLTLP